ncbi:hypothetical protein D3C76_1187540 [compost metagenome]
MNLFCSPYGINPPVGRPDPHDLPAKSPQYKFPQFVAITRSRTSVIGSTVAFDAGEESSWSIRVYNTQVYSEGGDTNLGMNLPALLGQSSCDRLFERAVESTYAAKVSLCQRLRPTLGELEEVFQVAHPDGLRPSKVNVLWAQGREQHQFLASTRDCNVESAFATWTVHRAEVH